MSYSVFTTQFDQIITGKELYEKSSGWSWGRRRLDKRFENYRSLTDLVRSETHAENLAGSERCLKLDPHLPERTSVSVLVDHSGSLKGERAIIACAVMELTGDYLYRLGVAYEILGFTTVGWMGGKSRFLWNKMGRQPSPGRLNDLLHIIYKDGTTSLAGAPSSIKCILSDDALKENIDGEAVCWAAGRLRNIGRERNVMIVVSDGAPVDDSTLRENNSSFLWNHLQDVVAGISAEPGFSIAGIGINYDVQSIYPKCTKVNSIFDLPEKLPSFLERTLCPR